LLSYYLGIEVRQGSSGTTIAQGAYASSILEKAGMKGCNACHVPMEARLKLSKANGAARRRHVLPEHRGKLAVSRAHAS
jgi:hypothetical protein